MQTHKRLIIVTVLAAALLPTLTSTFLLGDTRGVLQGKFETLLSMAQDSYKERSTLDAREKTQQDVVTQAQTQSASVAHQKHVIRLQIAALRAQMQDERNRADTLALSVSRADRLLQMNAGRLALLVNGEDATDQGVGSLLRRLFGMSLSPEMDRDLHGAASALSVGELRQSLSDQRDASAATVDQLRTAAATDEQALAPLEQQHDALIIASRAADAAYDQAMHSYLQSEARQAEIRREVAQVHADVLELQGEMALIDARIRRTAERDLRAKGLIDSSDLTTPSFSSSIVWPVHGTITAVFHDRAYEQRFGTPHEGVDIAQAQGSPVGAAADGVVFLARDGGANGYTYVLIGHRDGYATLYGHLSRIDVVAGQEVRAGQTIGLSGGRPGSPGAGPMTTGEHLHFEVIQNGVNIDPLSVLAK